MTVAAIDRFGPPSVLVPHRLPVPRPGPGQVLIALDFAGVGVWHAEIRSGKWKPPGPTRFPLVLGTDGAGVVARATVPIAATYALRSADKAHRRLARGHVLGRLVLRVHSG